MMSIVERRDCVSIKGAQVFTLDKLQVLILALEMQNFAAPCAFFLIVAASKRARGIVAALLGV